MTIVARHEDQIVVTYSLQEPVVLSARVLSNSTNYSTAVMAELTRVWGQDFVRGLVYLDEITEIF